jgi:hypothetical protein
MFKNAFIYSSIVVLSLFFFGCGVRPQMDYYIKPVAVEEEQKVEGETGSVSISNEVLSITISAVSVADLIEVTSDPHINPYIYVDDWGRARPRYTVFDFAVRNNSESELMIDLNDAILMDDEGEQYEAIPYEEFEGRYDTYGRIEQEIIYHPYSYYPPPYYRRRWRPYPWYYHYDLYRSRRPFYVRRVYDVPYFKRIILKGTMYRPINLYPGGKRQGFLVFPLVDPGFSELKIILPRISDDEGKGLEFRFERIPLVED